MRTQPLALGLLLVAVFGSGCASSLRHMAPSPAETSAAYMNTVDELARGQEAEVTLKTGTSFKAEVVSIDADSMRLLINHRPTVIPTADAVSLSLVRKVKRPFVGVIAGLLVGGGVTSFFFIDSPNRSGDEFADAITTFGKRGLGILLGFVGFVAAANSVHDATHTYHIELPPSP